MVSAWVYVGLALLIVFSLGVFVGALVGSPGPWRRRGGTVDLSRGAARGELDLDWNFPRCDVIPGPLGPTLVRRAKAVEAYRESLGSEVDRNPSFGV